MALQLTSPAFDNGSRIPQEFTADGQDFSPPLRWMDVPGETRTFAVICQDPDAPKRTWTHWVAYNIPPTARELPKAVRTDPELENGLRQGKNDFGRSGYGGPAPPPGPPHRYEFCLYALDTSLDLPPGATREQLLDAMRRHILAQAQLTGVYSREPRK